MFDRRIISIKAEPFLKIGGYAILVDIEGQ